ncbi:hypothetical protein Tco_0997373 [Tanacetum coccineum]
MAWLLFRTFRVDRTEFRVTMQGEMLQLEMGEFRTKLAMQILMRHQYLNKDNVFQADQCDAFDSDVNEAPTS